MSLIFILESPDYILEVITRRECAVDINRFNRVKCFTVEYLKPYTLQNMAFTAWFPIYCIMSKYSRKFTVKYL